jgi:hypothetical protein
MPSKTVSRSAILAATPAINVQIFLGVALPANYQADPAWAVCAESGNQKAQTSTVKPSTEGRKITAKRTVWVPVLAQQLLFLAWPRLSFMPACVPGSAVESKLRNGSHRLKRSGIVKPASFSDFPVKFPVSREFAR